MTTASDLRAGYARIPARHLNNVPDAIAAIRVSTDQRIAEKVDASKAHTCAFHEPAAFAIPTRRDRTR
jgi:hypothetical protein